MEINYNVKGLCYAQDILINNNPVSRMLFNYDCIPISEANDYMDYNLNCRRCSYNSIKVISYDLCKLYNFLNFTEKRVKELVPIDMRTFIVYLKNLQVRKGTISGMDYKRNRYAIENTMLTEIPSIKSIQQQNIIAIDEYRNEVGLKDESVYRIFFRVREYLRYLSETKNYEFNKSILRLLNDKKAFKRFLIAEKISKTSFQVKSIDDNMIYSKDEIVAINSVASANYEVLLYYILENTGIRIGEALGLKIKLVYKVDITEKISGDIVFENDRWKICVNWEPKNPYFCRVKGHCTREILLKKNQSYEFQLLLERYIKYWYSPEKLNELSWLFVNNANKHLTQNTAYKQFRRTAKKAGLSNICPTLHKYRHTFCTRELNKGVPIEFISKLLGHKNIEITQRIYEHVTPRDVVIAREKYDNYINSELNE